MRLHFTVVPVFGGADAEAALNTFLASHRVLAVERQLIAQGTASAWAVCVSYLAEGSAAPAPTSPGKRAEVDYRDVLSDADFHVFAELRSLRKELAAKESVAPYTIFTNEQLAALVTQPARTLSDLDGIAGVGPARRQKYGQIFLDTLAKLLPAAPHEGQKGE